MTLPCPKRMYAIKTLNGWEPVRLTKERRGDFVWVEHPEGFGLRKIHRNKLVPVSDLEGNIDVNRPENRKRRRL